MPPVNTCPECGNHDMRVEAVDGVSLHVCGLCGAAFGARRAVKTIADADEAHAAGIAPGVWPLIRTLRRLSGLGVHGSSDGDDRRGTLPYVELGATAANALVQLENVAKSLRLCAGMLRRRWIVELAYERALVFVLRPARGAEPASAAEVREARLDLEVLARQLTRDMRLPWWRDGEGAPTG